MRLVGQHLEIQRGGMRLFQRLEFAVEAGTLLTITGANGTGKSTLLRAIAGLHKLDGGRVFIAHQGETLNASPFVHYLSDHNAMKAHLSLMDNLRFWAEFYQARQIKLATIFAQIGLGGLEHLPYNVLSTGQRRRLGLARLLLHHRPLWLLDEPNAGLDAQGCDFIAGEMRRHLAKGGLIVAATHLPLGIEAHQCLNLGSYQANPERQETA